MPHTDLDIRLRMHYVRQAQRRMPKLRQNLRQLGAVGPVVMPVAPHGASVVVKINVTHAHTTGAHLGYLQQRPKGLDGQRAVLYGPGVVSRQAFVQAAHQDPRQFRLVISTPEQEGFGRARFVEHLMQQMETDLQRPLSWLAANHYDTVHPHTHVVLRAVDDEGKEFFMSRHYFTQGFQSRAQALLNWLTREREQTEQLAATIHQVRDGVVRGTDDADGRPRHLDSGLRYAATQAQTARALPFEQDPMPARGTLAYVDWVVRDAIRTGYEEGYPLRPEQIESIRGKVTTKELGRTVHSQLVALEDQITALKDQMANQRSPQRSRNQEMSY